MKILVTGGAGYIGSTTAALLLDHGHEVIVFDNLSMGHRAAVPEGAIFILGELENRNEIDRAFKEHRPDAVIHFASRTLVGESMNEPFAYLGDNVRNALNLLESMVEHDVGKIVLSSTANLFDEPDKIPISEEERVIPGSPYGESKAIIERMLHWLHRTKSLRYGCLRYFNAAGATEQRGEDHDPETHLIPLVLQVALGQRDAITVFGDDYDTEDGTCVRDYIHIADLADAHLKALMRLDEQPELRYNLGNGSGFSIRQVIDTARAITGHDIPSKTGPRRPGDPATLVADSTTIRDQLGWQPKHADLRSIIQSAWNWHQEYPNGYRSTPSI
ncbi:UDP-glucose 4-epimerase GalE, partial [Verrucomicrobiales bacterium]|nr:UDP-glucose 4-epimerase GalE [Verrucomicrobiales bacterium]